VTAPAAELRRLGRRAAPLSPAQERLWFIDTASPGSATYHVPMFLRWREPLDPDALAAALAAVVRRHEVLRTTYRLAGGRPEQLVHDPDEYPVEVVERPSPDGAEELVRAAEREARVPFDLAARPPVRCVAWRVPGPGLVPAHPPSPPERNRGAEAEAPELAIGRGRDAVLLCVHHIAVDGWSLAPLFQDLAAAYQVALAGGRPELPELPLQYTDYAVWDRAQADRPEARRQAETRLDELWDLAGKPGRDAPSDERPGRQYTFPVPPDVWDRVGELARALRVTRYVVLFAAFQALLRQRWGKAEFLAATVTANRPHSALEGLVGFFANTVPLRCAPRPEWTFRQLCQQARVEAFRSLTYQRIPFDRLTAAAAARPAGTGRPQLAPVGFTLQNMPAPQVDGPCRWEAPVLLPTGTAKFDLFLMVEERPDGVVGTVEHATDHHPADLGQAVGEGFGALLSAAVGDPDRPVGTLASPRPTARSGASAPAPRLGSGPGQSTGHERAAADLFVAALTEAGLTPPAAPVALPPQADFFTLGGHSLLAVWMLSAAERRYGRPVPLREFLADPTVAGLSRLLAADPTPATRPPMAQPAIEGYDATGVQQRLWFLDQVPELRPAYLVPAVLELTGPVDAEALAAAVTQVLARHPVLRSRFWLDRSRRRVRYRTDGPLPPVTRTDAPSLSEAELRAHLAAACWSPFDLATGPLARAEVVAARDRSLLVLVAHHAVLDGWSQRLLLDQIAAAYRGPDTTDPKTTQVSPGSMQPEKQRVAAAIARLRGAPTDVALPYDRPRPGGVQPVLAASESVRLGHDLSARVRAAASGAGGTTFMLAAALLAVALARGTGQRDFLLAFPWAGRDAPGMADAVGMFVNTLVLRVDLTGEPDWREILARVRAASLAAYRDADVPFEQLAAALHPDRDLSRPPVTPVYLSAIDEPPPPLPLGPGVACRDLPLDPLYLKYELELSAVAYPDDLELAVGYPVARCRAGTATGLLGALVDAATDLAGDLDRRPLEGERVG
jgi:non-ribosomal peptide synthetase component F